MNIAIFIAATTLLVALTVFATTKITIGEDLTKTQKICIHISAALLAISFALLLTSIYLAL